MDYKIVPATTHDLTGLNDREISVIQAGLTLLANSAAAGNISYPEYKRDAGAMLGILKVTGYSYNSTTT